MAARGGRGVRRCDGRAARHDAAGDASRPAGYLHAERGDYKFRVRYQVELADTRAKRLYQILQLRLTLQHPDEDVEEALCGWTPLTAEDLRELAIWARNEYLGEVSDEALRIADRLELAGP